jgi:hypothetical protein
VARSDRTCSSWLGRRICLIRAGLCSKRSRLCTGCGGPAGVCSGFPVPAGIVYEKAVEYERGGVAAGLKLLCTVGRGGVRCNKAPGRRRF